jgi:excisionase family DNA binding protein
MEPYSARHVKSLRILHLLRLPDFLSTLSDEARQRFVNGKSLVERTMVTDAKAERVVPPAMSEKEREMARAAQRCIMAALDHSRAAVITLTTQDGSTPSVELPPAALRLIGQILGAMSQGQTVTVLPEKAEFSTMEAAHFLNVSRPFLIKLLEDGEIPFRKVGTHRRVLFQDLITYKNRLVEARHLALERLELIDRELGLDN